MDVSRFTNHASRKRWLLEYTYWLIDHLLAGRVGPVERPWDIEKLREAGIKVIVSLNGEANAAEIAAAGMRHYVLPQTPALPLFRRDKDELLRGIEPVLDVIHREVSEGHPTLVHCHSGKDRTGVVLTAFLVRYEGLSIEDAIARVRAVKPNAMSAPGYEATARLFAKREQGHRLRRKARYRL
jgi:protein-tyrosine phosphatase